MYSSEDIINALRCNHSLEFQGIDMVGCPRPDVIDNDKKCINTPSACIQGHEQNCKQHVHIFRKDNGVLLRIIEFRFMRSPTNPGGFIRCDDSVLQSLVRNKIIAL